MPDELTKRQQEVFDFIRELIIYRGYGPTIREICEEFGFASPNGAMGHLRALVKKRRNYPYGEQLSFDRTDRAGS